MKTRESQKDEAIASSFCDSLVFEKSEPSAFLKQALNPTKSCACTAG